MKKWRDKTYHLIYDEGTDDFASRFFDIGMVVLILINLIFVILDTFTMPAWYTRASNILEVISITVFSLEYLLRIWVAPSHYPNMRPNAARLRYMVSFLAIIDLLSVLPFYINILPIDLRVLRAVRIVRLLRVFKIERYSDGLETIAKVFKKKANQLLSSLMVVFLLLVIASVLMWNVEHVAQPDKFENALDGFWWAMGTITTAGYQDVYPVTVVGKFLSSIISLLGIGIIAVPTGIISAGFIQALGEEGKGDDLQLPAAQQIREFKALLDEGAITAEEYEEKKKELLKQ